MVLHLVTDLDTQIIDVLDTNVNENIDENLPKILKQYISNYYVNGNVSIFDYLSTCIDENDCYEINTLGVQRYSTFSIRFNFRQWSRFDDFRFDANLQQQVPNSLSFQDFICFIASVASTEPKQLIWLE